MAMNADGSHSSRVHDAGQSINSVNFYQQPFDYLKGFDHSQQNGWMDSDGFKNGLRRGIEN